MGPEQGYVVQRTTTSIIERVVTGDKSNISGWYAQGIERVSLSIGRDQPH